MISLPPDLNKFGANWNQFVAMQDGPNSVFSGIFDGALPSDRKISCTLVEEGNPAAGVLVSGLSLAEVKAFVADIGADLVCLDVSLED